MKTSLRLFVFLWTLLAVFSCAGEEEITPDVTFTTSPEELTLGNEKNAQLPVDFTATHEWQARVDVSWAAVSPQKGSAGQNRLLILAGSENQTGDARTGTLTLTVGGVTVRTCTFTQEPIPVLNVEQTQYTVPSEGGKVEVTFVTNLTEGQLQLYSDTPVDWITPDGQNATRALQQGVMSLNVLPNEARSGRKATFRLVATDVAGQTQMQSPAFTIEQAAASVGTSLDYSRDGEVKQLQAHTEGNGIPLVIVGDGFIDKEVERGFYEQVMRKAMENFFTEEPVRSLRNYFDVWMVTAISGNNAFGAGYRTKFDCVLAGGGSTGISGDHELVEEYALKVPELRANPDLIDETLVFVILNTEDYAGTTFFGFGGVSSETTEFAIGYCPIIDGMESENFRRVLCHECIGHGFAKLLDEYSYRDMGTIPTAEVTSTQRMQELLGWAMNVDFSNDRNSVKWSVFLTDERYRGADAYGETLGVYEGACTYWNGAWRPTEESMMRSNMHGFNAPSREAIYKRVMRTAFGPLWVYDYETFVAFDRAHLPQPLSTQTRAVQDTPSKPFARPRLLE